MVVQETPPYAQAVRKVYENDTLASVPAVSDIFHVACYPDVSSGKDIILWDDILAAFKNVVHVRFGTMILPFLKGPDFKNLDPLRLAALPGATLDVVVSGQMVRTVAASALKQELSSSTPSNDLSGESLQMTLPTLPQESSNAISILDSNTTSIVTTIKRSPVGGHLEAAMENYTHIDRPAHIAVLTQSMFTGSSEERYTANLAATANTAITTVVGRDPVCGLEERAMDNYSHIDYPLSFKAARGPQALKDDNPTVTTYTQTPTTSDSGNKRQHRASQVPAAVISKDITHTIFKANFGDEDAQVALGDMYKDGNGVPQDYQAAMDWYLRAAEQGNADAQRKVGVLYVYGLGVKQDYSTALIWYLKSADQGNAQAQSNIGLFYRFGQGVPLDYAEAMEWFLMAAGQGNTQAQSNIGLLYRFGQGVPLDYSKAMEWLLMAAGQGDADACIHIGNLYNDGLGVPQDFSQALEWYHKAAEQDDAYAQTNIGHIYRYGEGATPDYSEAMKWYVKAADQDFADAHVAIGCLYYDGKGVVQDYSKAMEWFMKAAEQGNAEAQYCIGRLYHSGLGVDQDFSKAMEWLLKSADQGFAQAQHDIGGLYENGQGVPKDKAVALKRYKKADKGGFVDAKKKIDTWKKPGLLSRMFV
ncbi:hypothetical protein BGZ91_001103 [Linnemannia elongata]|nr:hypothetical protein BGZ91_001103 [Linnemannia elongata]